MTGKKYPCGVKDSRKKVALFDERPWITTLSKKEKQIWKDLWKGEEQVWIDGTRFLTSMISPIHAVNVIRKHFGLFKKKERKP